MKSKVVLIILGFFFIGLVLFAGFEGKPTESSSPTLLRTPSGAEITLLVATTDEERARGLGGRPSLEENEGMLFVFSEPGSYGFWMKGMEFPLDIIWLEERIGTDKERKGTNKELVVVHMRENVATSTYPELFTPTEKASHVLELNAGKAQKEAIHTGSELKLE